MVGVNTGFRRMRWQGAQPASTGSQWCYDASMINEDIATVFSDLCLDASVCIDIGLMLMLCLRMQSQPFVSRLGKFSFDWRSESRSRFQDGSKNTAKVVSWLLYQ